MNKILVVDDDRRLRDLLVKFLKTHDFFVDAAINVIEARAYFATNRPDLVILDIMMPGETGYDFTAWLRQKEDKTLVLMLTAKDQLSDLTHGLDLGADDYMIKPFEPLELLARVKALLRRASPSPFPRERTTPSTFPSIALGNCVFTPHENTLRDTKTGEILYLSSTELMLLKILAQDLGRPLSRENLAQRLGHRVSERTVDVQITRLRRKLEDDPRHPRFLQTVRHIGYVLHEDTSPS